MRKLKFIDPYGEGVKVSRHSRRNIYVSVMCKAKTRHKSGWLFVFFASEKLIEEFPYEEN